MKGDGETHVAIDITLRTTLKAELRRSGVTAIRLLKDRRDLPDGLDARAVNRWMSGLVSSAPRDHVAYVTRTWAALSDDPGRVARDGRKLSRRGARHPVGDEVWIDVTPEMAAHLRVELARTGIASAAILRGLTDLPAGLNQRVVYGWLYGETRTTNEAHWTFVTELLAKADDHDLS